MVWYAWVLVTLFGVGAVAHLVLVDRPRKPITVEGAFLAVVRNGLFIWAVVSLAS